VSRFEFMREHQDKYSVAEMSAALGVSRSGYYRWLRAKPSARRRHDEQVKGSIEQIMRRVPGAYGYRPVHQHLLEQGVACGRDRTLRLMHELKLVGRARSRFKPLSTNSDHLFGYHRNLLKELGAPEHRDQIWVADTSFVRSEAGWCYLATVMDLCTRWIIGWSVSEHNDAELVCTALKNAALTRGEVRPGIVHHSDRGSTYASDCYQRVLARLKMRPSMSGRANCYDNAAMESFFGRYKTAAVRGEIFTNLDAVRAHVFHYIEIFYNRYRKHASLGYLTPMQAEQNFSPPMGGTQDGCCPSST